ncbi:methyltransferase [Actinomadura rubrobrunea]|uniref:Methyltransferase n=1 Tax=Actinomadura rubrobrunea TaxID=115335 RepID=A0A9W6PW91_9ACTN|nr:methyltransferase [Actinomadura rubrobrunea]GLW63942.1 methyltransferase [Actinomadura rubrobrunea]
MENTTTAPRQDEDLAERSPFDLLAALPARHQLMMLTMGRVVAPVIWALTELGVADHLAGGPQPVGELARRTRCHEPTLLRLLRTAAAFGVFTELPDGRFRLTPMSELLRADAEHSVRDLVLMNGTELFWRPYEALLYTARTGRPAFERVFGTTLFAYLEDKPDLAEVFHRAMTAASRRGAGAVAAAVDLPPGARVADIGGGQGYLLAEVLRRHPDCRGVLFDRPAAVEGADAVLGAWDLADRVECAAGDFFDEVPAGCDAYLLKHVLHDWPDEDALRILRNVREAIGDDDSARVHVVEMTIGRPNALDIARLLDIDMLVTSGGRERSVGEYQRLAAAAGLELTGRRAAAGNTVLVFRPVPRITPR